MTSASYCCCACTEKTLSHARVKRSQALLCSSLCQLWLLKQESVQSDQWDDTLSHALANTSGCQYLHSNESKQSWDEHVELQRGWLGQSYMYRVRLPSVWVTKAKKH